MARAPGKLRCKRRPAKLPMTGLPHLKRISLLALIDLSSGARDVVCWMLQQVEQNRRLSPTRLADEVGIATPTAVRVLRSEWVWFVHHVLGKPFDTTFSALDREAASLARSFKERLEKDHAAALSASRAAP